MSNRKFLIRIPDEKNVRGVFYASTKNRSSFGSERERI